MSDERVETGRLSLQGLRCVIEDGDVPVRGPRQDGFVPAARADDSRSGPCVRADPGDPSQAMDASGIPGAGCRALVHAIPGPGR